ncbi:hypothetical protein SSYIS1_40520 (plasmid) [Serratia symbiotica]|uniref:Uncharacterized protein n=1 Tax=Serratia symbiotica TaxID=138074 RepID=A0A455VIZ4_9GAMM|nr:hypothetical protein SSYIS1_40520 [Serratia symbiotica]
MPVRVFFIGVTIFYLWAGAGEKGLDEEYFKHFEVSPSF